MKENEWVSVEDSLPGLKKDVQVKTINDYQYFARLDMYNVRGSICFLRADSVYMQIESITHWRPIPEKRPDFSKLREGDLLLIEHINGYSHTAYLKRIIGNFWVISQFSDGSYEETLNKVETKKITRINLEEKTFEEI